MAHERIEQAVLGLGRGISDEAVVIGNSAVGLALPEFRAPHDIDLAVSEEAFGYLRDQLGWEEAANDADNPRLLKGGFDISTGWGGSMDYDSLRTRSWRTKAGVRVAGLPDVYAYKHARHSAADVADTDAIRRRLQDPVQSPFAAEYIPHEVAAARGCLPEELQADPDAQAAILLAANGLHIVYTLYGHSQIGQANQIVGDLERPEFGVPATYHNGFELLRDARLLQQHLANINAPVRDRLLALAIDPYSDAVYGNGRVKDNPSGHDELCSAELLMNHALRLGFSPEEADRMYAGVMGTTFDEATGGQRGKASADPLVRGMVGVDLQTLAEPGSVRSTFDLAVEDGFSARYNVARTIGRVLCEHDVRVLSTVQALEEIDRYADAKPADAPDGPTVMQAFSTRLAGNAGFHRLHRYPADWTLDNLPLRLEHADTLERLAALLLAREVTAVEAYRMAGVRAR